jgi:hypothetical protein
MGCTQSQNDAVGSNDLIAPRMVISKEDRQRNALRRHSTTKRLKYHSPDASSSKSSVLGGRSRAGSVRGAASQQESAQETMLNSDVGASHLIMSQRSGSFRSGGYGSPRLQATPRGSTGRPPMAPGAIPTRGGMDRRVSVGRFSDEPSDSELRARIAALVAKAKVTSGIDGDVEAITDRAARINVKLGLNALGTDGVKRVYAWVEDLHERPAETMPESRASCDDFPSPPEATLPHVVDSDLIVFSNNTPRQHPNSPKLVDDDVHDMIFFSQSASQGVTTPTALQPSRQKLTEDSLKALADLHKRNNSAVLH